MKDTTKKEPERNLTNPFTMLTAEEVGAALGTTPEKVHLLRQTRLLRAILTGKRWMFPQKEILRFQEEMLDTDLSSPRKIEETLAVHERIK